MTGIGSLWPAGSNISERVSKMSCNLRRQIGFPLRSLTLGGALLIRVVIQRIASVPFGDLLALAYTGIDRFVSGATGYEKRSYVRYCGDHRPRIVRVKSPERGAGNAYT
jgi:hypothetical protein